MNADQALEVYKKECEKFEGTRKLQWGFNIAFWTLLCVGLYFLRSSNIQISGSSLTIILACFFLAHGVYVIMTQRGLEESGRIMKNILNDLNREDHKTINFVVDYERSVIQARDLTGDSWLWIIFQLLCTGVILTVYNYVLR